MSRVSAPVALAALLALATPAARAQTPAEAAPEPSRAPGLAAVPRLIHLPLPFRPDGAPDTITVRMRVRVDREGKAEQVRAADPRLAALPPALADTLVSRATRALMQAKMAPARGPEGVLPGVRYLVVPFAEAPQDELERLSFGLQLGTYMSDCAVFTPPEKWAGRDLDYPSDLRKQGINGRVVVRMLVGTDGRVSDLYVRDAEHPGFRAPTLRALSTWRYAPATCDGEPLAVYVTVPVRFRTSLVERPSGPPSVTPRVRSWQQF